MHVTDKWVSYKPSIQGQRVEVFYLLSEVLQVLHFI
jgi:hypothetical protein